MLLGPMMEIQTLYILLDNDLGYYLRQNIIEFKDFSINYVLTLFIQSRIFYIGALYHV